MLHFRFFLAVLVTAGTLPAETRETFSYEVEWRLINAGRTDLSWTRDASGYTGEVKLYSSGLVSRLYKVNDLYEARENGDLCAQTTRLQSEEGTRKRDTQIRWSGQKSHYIERDLLKNETVLERDLEVPACVHDILGALAKLRSLRTLQPGQSVNLPISDGKKVVSARIEAQEKEKVSTPLGTFPAIRYEAFLFNDVLFKRNARLFVWISDDARRLPLQIRVKMRIHIGTVTFTLDQVTPPLETKPK